MGNGASPKLVLRVLDFPRKNDGFTTGWGNRYCNTIRAKVRFNHLKPPNYKLA
jgi:hypothetical protein